MKTPTGEQQREWVKTYKAAAIALAEVRAQELQTMTDEEALHQSEALLSVPPVWRPRPDWSGLVEQQAWFHKKRPR